MSLVLPEPYVAIANAEPAAFVLHAEQVQRNFERINAAWDFTDKQHAVGSAGEPGFTNGWVNYGGVYAGAAFYKAGEQVFLSGLVKTGAMTLSVFTLPTGYRPAAQEAFAVESNNLFGEVEVTAAGLVVPFVGNDASLSLSGISFRAA